MMQSGSKFTMRSKTMKNGAGSVVAADQMDIVTTEGITFDSGAIIVLNDKKITITSDCVIKSLSSAGEVLAITDMQDQKFCYLVNDDFNYPTDAAAHLIIGADGMTA